MKPENELRITGKLTHDAEYKVLQSGTAVCEIKIAKSFKPYGKEDWQTYYIKAKLWKDKADQANDIGLHKGDSVLLWGALTTEDYNGKQYLVMNYAELKDYEKSAPVPTEQTEPQTNDDVPF